MKTYIDIRWCIEDVLQCAKDNHIKLTKKEASAVLEYLEHKHDATIGINWDVILFWIKEVKNFTEVT